MTAALLDQPRLVTRGDREDVYTFEPQAKVLALLRVLAEHEPDGATVPWPRLRSCAFAVPRDQPLLSLSGPDEVFADIEPLLKTILINLHGQEFVKITPNGIRLDVDDETMHGWNYQFDKRCDVARTLFFPGE